MNAMTFSRVESHSLSALHLLSSSSHHFECLSVLACSFVSGWLQLQDVLYGQCFWVLWIPVIMGEALSVQWTFVVRDVRSHTHTHWHTNTHTDTHAHTRYTPTPWVIELIMFWALLSLFATVLTNMQVVAHTRAHMRTCTLPCAHHLARAHTHTAHHPFLCTYWL